MLTTNSIFDHKQGINYKWPIYLIEFDGEAATYCSQSLGVRALLEDDSPILLEDGGFFLLEGNPEYVFKPLLKSISGLSQRVNPEEGTASIGGITFELLDYNDDITQLISSDDYYFHRKKTTIKAGYAGMSYPDYYLSIMTGWVTDIKLNNNGNAYIFTVTDPQKWFQRKIFRGAEVTPVTFSGNAIDILLSILTSTGDGTNGDYDTFAEGNSLGIDADYIDVAAIEAVRDNWIPGSSALLSFTINDRERAKDWLEREIFKPFNLYPVIDGQGRFLVKPFKPPLPTAGSEIVINEDVIIGIPQWDMNLGSVVNEVEWHFAWNSTTEQYDTINYYIDSDSLTNRGPGKKSLVVKSKGLASETALVDRSKKRIFRRFANPPLKISVTCFFSKWTAEAGDIVSLTHSRLPDLETSTRGVTNKLMEVVNRSIDWMRGRVNLELLDTGFQSGYYSVISPAMTITSVSDRTNFYVSTTDAAKYASFTSPEVQVCDSGMRQKVSNITITSVNSTTGLIQCDDPGRDLAAGYKVLFSDYRFATAEQQNYGYIADDNDVLGLAILKFDNISGAFTVTNTLTGGTSGHTATIDRIVLHDYDHGELELSSATGVFQDNEEISDGGNTADADGTLSLPSNDDAHLIIP